MERLEELVVQAQLGDGAAYGHIVQRFQAMALSYAYSILGDYELAEDARQEAFLDAYCDLVSLREPAAFPGWLRKIVQKHSVQIIRKRRALTIPLEDAGEPVSPKPGPAELAQQRQMQERVAQVIGELPEHEREATRLFYLHDHSLKEIGRRLNIPVQTVKCRLHAARARLRQRLVEIVKKTVKKQSLAGDRRATRAASAEAIDRFDEELKPLLKVQSEEDQQQAADLLCAKGRLQRFSGQIPEALASFENGLEHPLFRRSPLCKARFHAEIGLTCIQTSDYAQARQELQAALTVARRHQGQPALLAVTHNALGMCAWSQGNLTKARRHYMDTVKISRKIPCEELEAEALNNLALLDWKAGHLTQALEGFQASLGRWTKQRNRFATALTLMNVGVIEENLGRLALARRHYEKALALAREVGFVQVQAATLGNLGNLALTAENWQQADLASGEALELARRIRDRRSQAIALENQALAGLGMKQFERTRQLVAEARKLARAIEDHERLLSLDLVEIEGQLAEGSPPDTAGRIEALLREAEMQGFAAELPRILRLKAQAEIQGRDAQAAHKTLTRALRESREQKNRIEEKRILALEKTMLD